MVLGILLGMAAAAQADAAPPADERIATISGYVGNWDRDGTAWFRLGGHDLKLVLPEGDEREAHWRLILHAAESGITLRIRFDASAGRLAGSGDHFDYPVCSIGTASGIRFGDEGRNCPPRSVAGRSEPERLLALGLARVEQDPEGALQLLNATLAERPELPPLARVLAHKERAEIALQFSAEMPREDSRHDPLLAAALADYRRIAALLPEDRPGFRLAMAETVRDLGGYAEAHRLYRQILRRWPDWAHEVALGTGATYRQQGDYAEALRSLDSLPDDQRREGMPFHYHRAWTLMLLHRDDEALAEIDQGLSYQPDYESAYLLRSCLRARLGRLQLALEDQEHAQRLVGEGDGYPMWRRQTLARSRQVGEALRRAIDSDGTAPFTAACEGCWDRWSRPRARSPVLDRAD
jgi:tetratricopeptide (TPR) repeat protein